MPEQLKEGSWTIRRGEGNTLGIIKPLIPFDCIIDTDVGLIDLIRNEYRSPDIFDVDLLDSFRSNREFIRILYHRTTPNPLIPFMKNKEDLETADDLYNQFMNQKYREIVSRSVMTGLYRLVYLMTYAEEVAPVIAFSNTLEQQVIEDNEILKKHRSVYIDDIPFKCKGLDLFYFKSVINNKYFSKCIPILLSKNICILDYGYNFAEDQGIFINQETVAVDMNRCHLTIISAYSNKEIG